MAQGSRCRMQSLGLVAQGLYYFRMAVPLVDSRISRKEIIVAFSVHVPYVYAFSFREDYRQWMVVVCPVSFFEVNVVPGFL